MKLLAVRNNKVAQRFTALEWRFGEGVKRLQN